MVIINMPYNIFLANKKYLNIQQLIATSLPPPPPPPQKKKKKKKKKRKENVFAKLVTNAFDHSTMWCWYKDKDK